MRLHYWIGKKLIFQIFRFWRNWVYFFCQILQFKDLLHYILTFPCKTKLWYNIMIYISAICQRSIPISKFSPFYAVGVIVAGPPGSGKSSCIQTLVDALSLSNQAGTSRQSQGSRTTGNIQENQHKLIKINPMVVDDCSLMFGYLNVNNDWVDGIFTSACRKANRVSDISSWSAFLGLVCS